MHKLLKSLLKSKDGVRMDAIRIHPGLFTDQDSLDKLLEVFQFNVQGARTQNQRTMLANFTKQNHVLSIGNKQFCFKESTLFNYWIYLEEKPATNVGQNDVAEMITHQGPFVFGEAIAIRRPTSKGSKATKKVELKDFAAELVRVGSVDDTLVTFPMRPPTKMVSVSPKLKNMGKLAIL